MRDRRSLMPSALRGVPMLVGLILPAYWSQPVPPPATVPTPASQAEDRKLRAALLNAVVRVISVAEAESAPPYGSDWFSETGLVVSTEGHVVTNATFAERTDNIVAIVTDGRRHSGTLIGTDPFSNLALFKLVNFDDEPPIHAMPNDLQDGDAIYCVTATADGKREIIKAPVLDAHRLRNRRGTPVLPYIEIKQDDSIPTIRGPIFDHQGKVVGFVTLQSSSEQKTQVVLAIPSGDVKRIANELRMFGRVRRSRIGLGVETVTDELAAVRGLAEPIGALVGQVSTGSPAQRAGLVVGDIILKVNSDVIRTRDDYFVVIERTRAGTRLNLEVLGHAGKRRLSVFTGEVTSGPAVGQPVPDDRKNVPVE
jgi:serine protease Do